MESMDDVMRRIRYIGEHGGIPGAEALENIASWQRDVFDALHEVDPETGEWVHDRVEFRNPFRGRVSDAPGR